MSSRFALSIETSIEPLFEISTFETACGWFGLIGQAGRLFGVRIGHVRRSDVVPAFCESFELDKSEIIERDWQPNLKARLQAYCTGTVDDFADIEIVYRRKLPPFRRAVLSATRRIPSGQTVSYLELASRAGSPKAARAVGNAMATNLFPIVVPCHRVVGSGGHLGGFTAPGGLDLKQELLAMESR